MWVRYDWKARDDTLVDGPEVSRNGYPHLLGFITGWGGRLTGLVWGMRRPSGFREYWGTLGNGLVGSL